MVENERKERKKNIVQRCNDDHDADDTVVVAVMIVKQVQVEWSTLLQKQDEHKSKVHYC